MMYVLDNVTFYETLGLEIQGWIVNLEGTRMDAALNELELIASGTPFGDYSQADYVSTLGKKKTGQKQL